MTKSINEARLASVWNGMKQRCRNPRNSHYPNYGGRGIQVRGWSTWPEFRIWAIESGYRQGLTIERIDNDGHYEPANCRWATRLEQSRNKTDTVWLTAFGETKPIKKWIDDPRCVVSYVALIQRLRKIKDMTPEELLSTPPLPNHNARISRGSRDRCPYGHNLAETRVWNKRGDYYCRTCKLERAKSRYQRRKST